MPRRFKNTSGYLCLRMAVEEKLADFNWLQDSERKNFRRTSSEERLKRSPQSCFAYNLEDLRLPVGKMNRRPRNK
jgi:uncharacterized protein (DUF2461 family)